MTHPNPFPHEAAPRALVTLDPHLIDAGGLSDRLESDAAEDRALLTAIRDYGQQVPILVRPHPDRAGRYQIVYGRRRVLAMRDLGQPVAALVRDLDDGDLVMAQGLENTARRGLSHIEKACFAAQMRAAGYKRRAICDAISVHKTEVSRMLATVDRIGLRAIGCIGAAPSVGRARWAELAGLSRELDLDEDELCALTNFMPAEGSDARFDALLTALTGIKARRSPPEQEPEDRIKPRAEPAARPILAPTSAFPIATLTEKRKELTLTLHRDTGFADWLIGNLRALHRDWTQSTGPDRARKKS